MVQRLGSPLISTATLKMTALLACGVGAILAGPSLYAQIFSHRVEASASDDDKGVWKLPPPPRYLIDSARTTEDQTATVPKPVATIAPVATPVARTVLMNPPGSTLPTPPAPPPPAVAAIGTSDAPVPGIRTAAPAPAPTPARAAPDPIAAALALPLPKAVAPTPKPVVAAPPVHTATTHPAEAIKSSVPKVDAHKPAAPKVAAPLPTVRPPASKSAQEAAKAQSKPRPGVAPTPTRVAQGKPLTSAAQTAEAPQQAAPPPQSQRIPVLSNILEGINSAGQAITNAVPKF